MSVINMPIRYFTEMADDNPSYTVTYTISPNVGTISNALTGVTSSTTGTYAFSATSADIIEKCNATQLTTYNDEFRDTIVTITIFDGTSITKAKSEIVDGISGYTTSNITESIIMSEEEVLTSINKLPVMVVADTSSYPTSKPDTTVTLTTSTGDNTVGDFNTPTSGAVTSSWTTGTGVWTATGPIADINTILAALTWTGATDYNGTFSITTHITDAAHTLSGTWSFTCIAVNDLPTWTNATNAHEYVVYEAIPINITPDPTVADVDDIILTVKANLPDATYGAFSCSTAGSVIDGDGNFTYAGTIADCNTALSNLIFTPNTSLKDNFNVTFLVHDTSAIPVTATQPWTRNPRMASNIATTSAVTSALGLDLSFTTTIAGASIGSASLYVFLNFILNVITTTSSVSSDIMLTRKFTGYISAFSEGTVYLTGTTPFTGIIESVSTMTNTTLNHTLSLVPSISTTSGGYSILHRHITEGGKALTLPTISGMGAYHMGTYEAASPSDSKNLVNGPYGYLWVGYYTRKARTVSMVTLSSGVISIVAPQWAGYDPIFATTQTWATGPYTGVGNGNNCKLGVIYMSNNGSGYTSPPTVSISPPPGSSAWGPEKRQATATATIHASGVVTGVTIDDAGAGYDESSPIYITLSGGGGIGATAFAPTSFLTRIRLGYEFYVLPKGRVARWDSDSSGSFDLVWGPTSWAEPNPMAAGQDNAGPTYPAINADGDISYISHLTYTNESGPTPFGYQQGNEHMTNPWGEVEGFFTDSGGSSPTDADGPVRLATNSSWGIYPRDNGSGDFDGLNIGTSGLMVDSG